MGRAILIPRKSLGQHFLVDENISRKIMDVLRPLEGENILEIGPGDGVLTRHLLASGANVTAVEVDPRAVRILRERFGEKFPAFQIICADFLETRLSTIHTAGTLRIIGNLPYNITTPILFHLLEERGMIRETVLMMQREVAERICAAPGSKDYGILSVILQIHTRVKLHFHISRNVFHPKPKVESSLISLQFTEERCRQIENYALFREIVRGTFGKRRKTIQNGLRMMRMPIRDFPESCDRFLNRRPEDLSPEEFITLSNALSVRPTTGIAS